MERDLHCETCGRTVRIRVTGSLIRLNECGRCYIDRTTPKAPRAKAPRAKRKAPRAPARKRQTTMGVENTSYALTVQDAPASFGRFVEPQEDTQGSLF